MQDAPLIPQEWQDAIGELLQEGRGRSYVLWPDGRVTGSRQRWSRRYVANLRMLDRRIRERLAKQIAPWLMNDDEARDSYY